MTRPVASSTVCLLTRPLLSRSQTMLHGRRRVVPQLRAGPSPSERPVTLARAQVPAAVNGVHADYRTKPSFSNKPICSAAILDLVGTDAADPLKHAPSFRKAL